MAFPQQGGAPLVKGQFGLFIRGFPAGYFLKAKIPTAKVKEVVVHPAGTTAPIAYPTGIVERFEDVELDYYQGTNGAIDAAIETWLRKCANVRTGKTSVTPQEAKQPARLVQYDTNGDECAEWLMTGCFVKEPGALEFEGGSSDSSTRTLKLSVDYVEKVR